jgi:DNA-binding NarL/FixJ family response regulator
VKAGADGYISKSANQEVVRSAIREVYEGRRYLDPNVTEGIFGRISGRDHRALTDRELSVLQSLSDGNTTREVAESMHVSEETVKTYLKQIYRKLGVHDRTEAVAEAFRRGIVH